MNKFSFNPIFFTNWYLFWSKLGLGLKFYVAIFDWHLFFHRCSMCVRGEASFSNPGPFQSFVFPSSSFKSPLPAVTICWNNSNKSMEKWRGELFGCVEYFSYVLRWEEGTSLLNVDVS